MNKVITTHSFLNTFSILCFVFTAAVAATPSDLQPELNPVVRFSFERVRAEQEKFLKKERRFSYIRKGAVLSSACLLSIFLYKYLTAPQQAIEQLSEEKKADLEIKAKMAFYNHVYPTLQHRCYRVLENALLLPVMYFTINGFLSWTSKDFLPNLLGILGSREKEAQALYEWFSQSVKSFVTIAKQRQSFLVNSAQAASYSQAFICAYNALVIYSESFLGSLLGQIHSIKPQHQSFKQELVSAISMMVCALESFFDQDRFDVTQEKLQALVTAQEVLSAYQKRILFYV